MIGASTCSAAMPTPRAVAATDFLARSFTWVLPGAATARGVGLFALQALAPVKSMVARQMMFGSR